MVLRRCSDTRQAASPTSCAAHCSPNLPPKDCVSMLQCVSADRPPPVSADCAPPVTTMPTSPDRGGHVGPPTQPAPLLAALKDEGQEEGQPRRHQDAEVDQELAEVVDPVGERGPGTGQRGDGAGLDVPDQEHDAATDHMAVDRGHGVVRHVGARPQRGRQSGRQRGRRRMPRGHLHLLPRRVQDDQAAVIGLHRLVEVDGDGVRDPGQVRPLCR